MKILIRLFAVSAALTLVANLHAATVTVTSNDADTLSDVRLGSTSEETSLEIVLDEFREHLNRIAKRYLTEGQTLEINFTDIDLAGEFEPWRSMQYQDVRWVKDIYIPRLKFDYKLTGADGEVIAEGSENLTDMSFLWHVRSLDQSSVRYEKEILTTWMRRFRTKS